MATRKYKKLGKGRCVKVSAGDRCVCRPKKGGPARFRKCSSRTK